jgi:hypothetical protein
VGRLAEADDPRDSHFQTYQSTQGERACRGASQQDLLLFRLVAFALNAAGHWAVFFGLPTPAGGALRDDLEPRDERL